MRALRILCPPLTDEVVRQLIVGERVLFQGEMFTARDAAHQVMLEQIEQGNPLPFPVAGAVLYYTGPCPAPPGMAIGSAGPTTSARMDSMTEPLLDQGLKGMIGKGERSQAVVDAIRTYNAVYFAAIGGAGALIAQSIKEASVIAYESLGSEAVFRFVVDGFPAIVAIDSRGNSIFRRFGNVEE